MDLCWQHFLESLGPAALRHRSAKRIAAPKRVVDFLVELEKNHLATFAATAVAAAAAEAAEKAAAAGNRNEAKAIEKSKETNPEEKWTEDKEHSEHLFCLSQIVKEKNPEEKKKEDKKYSEDLSLESLTAAVEDFTPRDLNTRIGQLVIQASDAGH